MKRILTALRPLNLVLALLCVLSLGLMAVGLKTTNLEDPWMVTKDTAVGGPFESSNTNSRYALVESIALRGSFLFDLSQARFAVPDVVENNGRYFTSFMPGMSFWAVPFYWLGQYYATPHLTTFLSTLVLAVFNGILLYRLGRKLGANTPAAILGAGIFLFATNALTYSTTLTQHHGSTAIILLALLIALRPQSVANNIKFGILCGLGFSFDFPNLFMMFPIGLYILSKHVIVQDTVEKIKVSFKLSLLWIAVAILPFLAILGYYNLQLTDSPINFAQFSLRTNAFDTAEKRERDRLIAQRPRDYEPTLPFSTRLQLSGSYTLLVSNERSWLYYSPVLLLGIWGLVALYKRHPDATLLITSVVAVNFVLYSMFGDPWGGWSFGARYLIPSAALMSLAIGLGATFLRRNLHFWIILFVFLGYSVAISAVGAITSATVPPKQESTSLVEYIPWTYKYNFFKINEGKVYSLAYQAWFKSSLTPMQFYIGYASILIAGLYAIAIITLLNKESQK